MSLLAILISLALEKLAPAIDGLRSLNWFQQYHHWIHARLANRKNWQGIPSLLIIILLPVLGIAVIQHFLNDLLALFSFLFSIAVLVYCLGPKDEHRRVNDYLDAIEDKNRSDNDSLQTDLSEILRAGGIVSRDIGTTENETTRIDKLIKAILIITHDRMLAILFWFVILGPMGALLYRLTLALLQIEEQNKEQSDSQNMPQTVEDDANEQTEKVTLNAETDTELTSNSDFNSAVKKLHHLLGWIPSHLTALSYAVMGSFVHALRAWQNTPNEYSIEISEDDTDSAEETNTTSNHNLLLRIGMASLQFDRKSPEDNDAVRETLGMCGRSLVAWVTILALMTLAGWAS